MDCKVKKMRFSDDGFCDCCGKVDKRPKYVLKIEDENYTLQFCCPGCLITFVERMEKR